jgi:hypothetical protein
MRRSEKTAIFGILFCMALIFISAVCAPKMNPDKWIFLGAGQFDERHDTANIRAGASEGVFSRLRFEVTGLLELNCISPAAIGAVMTRNSTCQLMKGLSKELNSESF